MRHWDLRNTSSTCFNIFYNASSLTQYNRAQSGLPDMIGDFLEAIAKRTGWSFTVVGGGPDGAKEGQICTISLHTGKDAYGQTFPKAIPDYRETVLVPYSKFLESVYRELPTFSRDFALKEIIHAAQTVRKSFIPKAEETPDKALATKDASSPDKVLTPNVSTANAPTLSPGKDTTFPMLIGSLCPDKVPTSHTSTGTAAAETPTPSPNTAARLEDTPIPSICPPSTTSTERNASASTTELFTFPTLTIPPEMTASTSTGMTDLVPNAFVFDFSSPFQPTGTNENGTHHYGNTFGDVNLSFTSLMAMPLDGDGGEHTGAGLTGWGTLQAGQSAYTASGNWGLRNTLDSPWSNTFNGEMNMMGQMDPMVIDNSVSAMAPKLANAVEVEKVPEAPIASEVAMNASVDAVEVEKFPEAPIASEVAVDAGVDVMTTAEVSNGADATVSSKVAVDAVVDVVTAAEVSNGADAAVSITSNVQEKRMRKPAARGEIMPLTTRDAPANVPEWFSLARAYLEDGLDVKEWRDCVETWVNMENTLGLSEVGSVR